MHAILKDKISTIEGVHILGRFRDCADGRAVLMALWHHSKNSTAARLATADMISALTNMALDGSWTKSYESFITFFVEKAENYNEMQQDP